MSSAEARRPRATVACARCRRQKLKCNSTRPCTLCLHAGAVCEPQTTAERSRLNQKRLSAARAQKTTTSQPSVAGDDLLMQTSPAQHDALHISPLSMAHSSPSEGQQHTTISSSTMELARTVNGDDDLEDVGGGSAEENSSVCEHDSDTFTLTTMSLPPQEIIESGIEAYFDRFHWFVQLLHQPSFEALVASILSRTAWREDEIPAVTLVLLVSTCGLRCAANDRSWTGSRLLQSHSVNADSLIKSLLNEIGVHFYNIITQSRLQSYQIIMLLEVYHVYFGSLNFARHMAGVPVRVAHGLGLHRDKRDNMDDITYQVGIRCWNHAIVGELFGSMIYGQPSSLDPDYSKFRALSVLPGEENEIPHLTASLPILASGRQSISALTFHVLKFELYEMIQSSLQQIKALNLQHTMTMQDLRALLQAVERADARLRAWREKLPEVFSPQRWGQPEPWTVLQAEDIRCTAEDRSCRKRLALQGITLQVLHDSAVILAHRPLLQSRISVSNGDTVSDLQSQHGLDPLKTSADAALRISRTPVHQFQNQLALSFVFMHLFTAGVILCVPPIQLPYSELASESKAGVLRIITASRAMASINSIARHTDQVLTTLARKTIQREMDGALRRPGTDVFTPPILHSNVPRNQFQPETSIDASSSSLRPVPEWSSISQIPCFPQQTITSACYKPSPRGGMTPLPLSDTPSMIPYLQFGGSSSEYDMNNSGILGEHLDETFGAFEQMYDLNFMGGAMSGDIFATDNNYPGS